MYDSRAPSADETTKTNWEIEIITTSCLSEVT